jgi:hypothetical protein
MGMNAWSLALRAAVCVGLMIAFAAAPARRAEAQQAAAASYDESLRALKYYRYKRVAEAGPERGRELYYSNAGSATMSSRPRRRSSRASIRSAR